MPLSARKSYATVEATVTSRGRVTLPEELRNRLGIQKGSKIRFSILDPIPVTVEPVLYELEDLWKMADQSTRPQRPLSFEEMNAAKSGREW